MANKRKYYWKKKFEGKNCPSMSHSSLCTVIEVIWMPGGLYFNPLPKGIRFGAAVSSCQDSQTSAEFNPDRRCRVVSYVWSFAGQSWVE